MSKYSAKELSSLESWLTTFENEENFEKFAKRYNKSLARANNNIQTAEDEDFLDFHLEQIREGEE